MKHFKAPWGKSLLLFSILCIAGCIAWGVMVWNTPHPPTAWAFHLISFIPLAICSVAGLFTIRGYTITTDSILVHRLFWSTSIMRTGFKSAQFDSSAMKWSIRLWGNGGLFSITGYFWNKRIGSYRAFVTDPRRAVVIRDANRTLVLSPETPEEFIRELALGEPQK